MTFGALFLRGEISTNDLAMTAGSSFWLAQVEDNPNRFFVSGAPCTRSVIVTRLPDLVRRHEGVGRPPRSHAYFFTHTFDRDVGPALEPLVDRDQTTFTARVKTAIGAIGDRANVEADAADDPGTNVMGELRCNMNFSYPSRRGGG